MKILSIVVGVLIGGLILFVVFGLTASMLVCAVLGLTLLVRRDWVPLVYNVRSLGVRRWTTAVTALGLALVSFAFTSVLMLATGVRETLRSTGSDGNAKVIRKGSQAEVQSGLLPDIVRLLSAVPETAVDKDGKAIVSPEVLVLIYAPREDEPEKGANLNVRGVGAAALELHPPRHLDGRMFQPGTSEIVIGRALEGRFKGMRLGEKTHFARRDWTVVGVMDHAGSAYDSEVWGDVDQFLDAFQRRPAYSSLTLRLSDPGALEALKHRVENDPNLSSMEVFRETDYWAAQSQQFSTFVKFLGIFMAIILSIGAVLGAMITMYAQVAARTREIGTLRALGFRRRAVLVSFVVESILMALGAGLIGLAAATAWTLVHFHTMNFQSFSEVSFGFALTPSIIVASLLFAVAMGFAGGLLPAVRAARMAIVRATRGG